jgi:hypothetical protein
MNKNQSAFWEKINMKGITPGPLAHHTTVAHGDKMYLFGGIKPNG